MDKCFNCKHSIELTLSDDLFRKRGPSVCPECYECTAGVKDNHEVVNEINYNGHIYVLADGLNGLNNCIKILQTACGNYSETNSTCTEACPLYYQCHEEAIANWPPVVCATCKLSMEERVEQLYPCKYCKLDQSELAKEVIVDDKK